MKSFFTVILLPSDDHSIRAFVICAQSTNRFLSLPRKKRRLVLWAEDFITVLRNRLYKTESAVSNIAGSLYF